jgi:hypothetical protein
MTSIPVPIIDSGDYNYSDELQWAVGDKVYAMRYQTSDDGYQKPDADSEPDAYQSSLVELVWDGTRWRSGSIAKLSDGTYVTLGLSEARLEILFDENKNSILDDAELIKAWQDYLTKVVRFLEEAGMPDADAGFPTGGTFTEKIEYLFYGTRKMGEKPVFVG